MIEIIPAIDLIGGKCVRLVHGDFAQRTVYSDDPVETAKKFEAAGLRRLHVVDLDGARSGSPANIDVAARIAGAAQMTIDFGGGIKTVSDIERVFDAGVRVVNLGSVAVEDPERFFGWLESFGDDRILLGADARNGKISTNGWQNDTGIGLIDFLHDYHDRGVRRAFVTDISRDGTLAGPASRLYGEIRRAVPTLELIASGGVGSITDIENLERVGCAGVIVGKAIYEGRIRLDELIPYVG